MLTRNKEEDRDLEHSVVISNSAEPVLSNNPTNQHTHQPGMSMQHSYTVEESPTYLIEVFQI